MFKSSINEKIVITINLFILWTLMCLISGGSFREKEIQKELRKQGYARFNQKTGCNELIPINELTMRKTTASEIKQN